MAAQENRILTDNFTELNVRMRGFGIYTMPRMCSQKDANFRFTHSGAKSYKHTHNNSALQSDL